MKIVLISIFSLCVLVHTNHQNSSGPSNVCPRIVGGSRATRNQFPYQVIIINKAEELTCGGTIIARQWVLSAAHCLLRWAQNKLINRKYTFVYSERIRDNRNGIRHAVRRIIVHPKYSLNTYDYDMGLLQVYPPFKSGQIIPVVPQYDHFGTVKGNKVTICGFGSVHSRIVGKPLSWVQVDIISLEMCRFAYRKMVVTNRMFCAYTPGKDACSGDSGGPVTYEGCQVGIVSWGVGCARPNTPGVYSHISHPAMHSFIRTHVGNLTICKTKKRNVPHV